MRSDFLASLHCPYSGSPLSLSMVTKEDGEQIHYGIVTSEAGDFPIVEGILRLHVDKYRRPIVEHIRQKRPLQAFTVAVDETPFGGRSGAGINFLYGCTVGGRFESGGERLLGLKRSFVRVLTDSGATFAEIAKKLSTGRSADWQICRFSMPTFLPVFPLVHVVRADGPILDFGCGTGQASFLISRMWPDSEIVCGDYSFCSLYMAKKYFVPAATYICLDGDYPLPFESGQFSTIFSSDTLHVIDSKLNLAQEFARVGDERAVTVLPHLHNRLAWPYAKSLTPHGYRQLFRGVETRIMPEEQVMRDYFFDDALDLGRDWSDEELAASEQGLSVVSSMDSSVFKRTEGLWDERIRTFRNPRINPAYRVLGKPGDWDLKRRTDDRYAKTINQQDKTCIPDTCKLTARSVDSDGLIEFQRTDPREFFRLAKELVVLDLPERFMSQPQMPQHSRDWLPGGRAGDINDSLLIPRKGKADV